jgi:hypothetical protein
MRIEKIATDYETRYISNDEKVWETQLACEQYEKLLIDTTPLKNLSFFNSRGEPIDIFELKEIPHFAYLIIKKSIEEYLPEVVQAIIGNSDRYQEPSYELPHEEGIWENDWTSAYSGGRGHNGWVKQPSINKLQEQIKNCQDKIKFFEKLIKNA